MTYAYPGDFEERVSGTNFYTQVLGLGDEHNNRNVRYGRCWDFYNGKQWRIEIPEGHAHLTINYIAAFVKKLRRFTYRNGWTMVFNKDQIEAELDTVMLDVWKKNNLHEITNEAGEYAGIFGDFYINVQWIEGTDTEEGRIKITALDPRYVFPEYNMLTGEMDFCVVLIPFKEKVFTSDGVKSTPKIHREIHYKDRTIIQRTDSRGKYEDVTTLENPFGKIMIVHGINQPRSGSRYGKADTEDILDAQALFNEKISDAADIIDYHAAPITLIYGAKARQLEKGANKVWSGLPPTAKVENLSSEGNIPASLKFITSIKEYMHEIVGVPVDAFGIDRGISNTSAVALAITYEPMIETAEDKRYYFSKALKQVNERIVDILLWAGLYEGTEDKDILYDIEIKFGDLLPRDRSSSLNDIETELRLNLESRRGALDRLDVTDTEQKLQEIEEENLRDAEHDAKIMEITGESKQKLDARDSKAQNPVIHGEQVHQQMLDDKYPSA